MVNTAPTYIRARQIRDADVPAAVDLLMRGIRSRPRKLWEDVFASLGRRTVPGGFPRYGYVIESNGKLVGIIILIFSTVWENGEAKIRCNSSSLYVDPAFRLYAPLLTSKAFQYKNVTVLNVTPAPHTYRMVETTGFARYSNGVFAAIPIFSRPLKDVPVRIIDPQTQPDVPFDPNEPDLLLEHEDYGCKSLWCITTERAYPFVFRFLRVKALVPCAHLVYCRNVNDFAKFARPIGSFLARNRQLLVLVDANGPIPGLVGKYFAGKRPKYFLGPDQPRLGDLAHTEIAMFGM
jgi:hypothetical protein